METRRSLETGLTAVSRSPPISPTDQNTQDLRPTVRMGEEERSTETRHLIPHCGARTQVYPVGGGGWMIDPPKLVSIKVRGSEKR